MRVRISGYGEGEVIAWTQTVYNHPDPIYGPGPVSYRPFQVPAVLLRQVDQIRVVPLVDGVSVEVMKT